MLTSKEEVGLLLDNLYLELLELIEKQTKCRVNIEKFSNGGQLLLAKTRYLQGSQSIGVAQIPTENSSDFNALCRVVQNDNNDRICGMDYTLEHHEVDKEDAYVEPLNWFGVLVPSSLRTAAIQYKKCVYFVIESANIQREILAVLENIKKLKTIKSQDPNSK